MWIDPIVAETRALREAYASQFNHDAEAIHQDILKRQMEHPERLVSFPARRPQTQMPTLATAATQDTKAST